ncbi:putative folate/pteridine transporter [Trypanosoma cruzi]|uniref:Putative folate/pteridine transporter n=1 Tax=Trypanosoma cruzi TaxID=5693 RepID=A0A2V2WS77_TRYCR|nr:putative folate/pteridine transporter [Trypanosoma cruzi]
MATDDSAPPRIMSAEETVPARSVHIDARALFSALPCLRRAPIFGTSVEAFGPKCVLSMGLSEFLCKGVADFLIRCSLFPMFRRRYGVDAMTYQRMANLASMGWSMKPITAMFSDIFSFLWVHEALVPGRLVRGRCRLCACLRATATRESQRGAGSGVCLPDQLHQGKRGHPDAGPLQPPDTPHSSRWLVAGELGVVVGAPGLPCRLRHCRAPRRRQSGVDRRDRCRHAAVCDDVLLRDELVRGEQEPCKSCRGCQIHARETAGGKEGFQ